MRRARRPRRPGVRGSVRGHDDRARRAGRPPAVHEPARHLCTLRAAARSQAILVIAYLLAIGCALSYGAAVFMGGWTPRRAPAVAVVAVSQLGGLVLLGPLVPFASPGLPSAHDLLWGAVAGLAAGPGILLLYRALAGRALSVVSPATAVTAVSSPGVGETPARER